MFTTQTLNRRKTTHLTVIMSDYEDRQYDEVKQWSQLKASWDHSDKLYNSNYKFYYQTHNLEESVDVNVVGIDPLDFKTQPICKINYTVTPEEFTSFRLKCFNILAEMEQSLNLIKENMEITMPHKLPTKAISPHTLLSTDDITNESFFNDIIHPNVTYTEASKEEIIKQNCKNNIVNTNRTKRALGTL